MVRITLKSGAATIGGLDPIAVPGEETVSDKAQFYAVEAGFDVDRRLYIEQRGVPSEVLLLRRREALGIRS